jgi:uncharacterized protein (TIGR03067 family)
MKRCAWFALVAGLLAAAGTTAVTAKEKADQVTWKLMSLVVDGTEVPQSELQDFTLITQGTRYVAKKGAETVAEGTVRLDTNQRPMTIDRTAASGADKGKTAKGIIEIHGATVRICWALPGKDRPRDFSCSKGSGHILEVLQRVEE